ncbi:hypothetical protein [Nocardioides sp.]|uniref:hypothetical protein n=1 Tax=Nocardioides sp. TaxID=35761 RepID=UPI00378348B3
MTTFSAAAQLDRPPPSAWALAWMCLAGQVLALAARGPSRSDPVWVLLSMVLSAAVVAWVSAGVLRARTGRLVLVWIVFGIQLLLVVAGLATGESGLAAALEVVPAVGQAVALWCFCRTDWFRQERERGGDEAGRPSVAGLVLVAVVVGALGGFTAPATGDNPPQQLRVGL